MDPIVTYTETRSRFHVLHLKNPARLAANFSDHSVAAASPDCRNGKYAGYLGKFCGNLKFEIKCAAGLARRRAPGCCGCYNPPRLPPVPGPGCFRWTPGRARTQPEASASESVAPAGRPCATHSESRRRRPPHSLAGCPCGSGRAKGVLLVIGPGLADSGSARSWRRRRPRRRHSSHDRGAGVRPGRVTDSDGGRCRRRV